MSHFAALREQYLSLKKRNLVSGILLGFLALSCIVALSFATFTRLPSFHFDFTSLSFGGADLFEKVESEQKGKINILLTGMGGEQHEGGDLTDTIILASLNNESKTVTLFSIPRDLYINYPRG